MSFKLSKGKTKFMWFPMTVSTVLTIDSLVTLSSGQIVAATSSTAAVDILGVVRHAIASTDSDYATARFIEVQIPVEKHTVWLATVTATLVTTDVGAEVDLTDAVTVNRGATSIKAVKIAQFISTVLAKVFVKFNGSY